MSLFRERLNSFVPPFVSPSARILNLAKADGWHAIYDPTNLDTVTITSGRVVALADGLGNANDLIEQTSSGPALDTLAYGDLNALTGATGDYLEHGSDQSLAQPNTLITVFQSGANSVHRQLYDRHSAVGDRHNLLLHSGNDYRLTGGATLTGGTTNTNVHVISGTFDGVSSLLRLDGAQIASGDAGAEAMVRLKVGANDAETIFFNGPFLPLAIYNGAITAAVRNRMEQLLMLLAGI